MEKWVASAGETFDMIAYLCYGTSDMAGVLMENNTKYAEKLIMDGGEEIILPEIETTEQGADWK